jgi:hypothetical protein
LCDHEILYENTEKLEGTAAKNHLRGLPKLSQQWRKKTPRDEAREVFLLALSPGFRISA